MSLLSNVDSANVTVEEKDTLGGGMPDSGAYPGVIELAYLMESAGGAVGLALHFKADSGPSIRETVYITSGTAKGKKTYYENRQGEQSPLPGFVIAEALALMTTDTGILEAGANTEKKVVNLYNRELGRETPTEVDALVGMMGKRVCLGVIKSTENKNVKNESTGKYEPTAETRETLEIDKVFRDSDGATVSEVRAGAEATFIAKWREKWEGKVRDKVKPVDNKARPAGAARAGAAAAGGGSAPSLFGNKG